MPKKQGRGGNELTFALDDMCRACKPSILYSWCRFIKSKIYGGTLNMDFVSLGNPAKIRATIAIMIQMYNIR